MLGPAFLTGSESSFLYIPGFVIQEDLLFKSSVTLAQALTFA